MQQYDDLDAIHIVSHGNIGELSLGNTKLNQNTLDSYADDLISWQDSIADDGDILLYGCNVAANTVGKEFVEELSQYTAADVLASTDLTGNEDLRGDWDLEYATGDIEESLAFDAEIKNGYQYILFGLDSFSGSYSGANFSDFTGSDFYLSNDFDFDTNIDLPNSSEPNNIANIDLEQYDFSNPAYNTAILNFEPSQINFNANDFNYDSVDINDNSITFGFTSGVDFAPSAESIESLELDFDNYTFDFDSRFSFNADSVTFEKDKVRFEFDSDSLTFNSADLFSANNIHLFEYKFLNDEITLPEGELTFADLNASDFRALNYAFPGDEIFDGEYYFDTNAIPADMNPFTDYIENGWKRGSDPHPLFDTSYYLTNNIDVRDNGAEPFKHYIMKGYTELNNPNRDPHPLFDTSYYQDNNTDVVKANKNPLLHYLESGYTENFDTRDPNPLFDSSYYNHKNPDVMAAGMNPLLHYMQFGWKESRINNPGGFNPNRDPNAFFDTSFYFEKHDDVLNASYYYDSANPVQHMIEYGFAELRITNSYSESEKIAKITKVFTPDSDPGEISNLQKNLKKDGIELSIYDDKSFKISQSITGDDDEFLLEKLFFTVVGGAIVGTYELGRAARRLFDSLIEGNEDRVYDIKIDRDSAIYGYSIIPDRTLPSDTFSIDYGDPSLSDLLRVQPFPGQTENEIAVEIFTAPEIDGIEDFTIFPEDSGVFLPTTTEFPQGDKTLEAILNDGLFVNGEEDPLGSYVLTSTRNGDIIGYNPNDFSNANDWNARIERFGPTTILDLEFPYRVPNSVREAQRKQGININNEPTHGIFFDGDTGIRLTSGYTKTSRAYRNNYMKENNNRISAELDFSLRHVEGNAATIMRELNISEGFVIINHETGPCPSCLIAVEDILLEGQTLIVFWNDETTGRIERIQFDGKASR